jgi:hypothetical protein
MTTTTRMTTTARASLPSGFTDLEPWVADWALATRKERYDRRLTKNIQELGAFYDAIAPRAEEAITYLNGLDIRDLPEPERRLLQLLYSMVLISYAVNIFDQPRIPDSGAAFFETLAEPVI